MVEYQKCRSFAGGRGETFLGMADTWGIKEVGGMCLWSSWEAGLRLVCGGCAW